MISREEAKKLISEIIHSQTPVKTGQTLPIRKGETFEVFRIPIEYLVPNQDNDRITWKIREYEADNNRKLDIESEADVEFLYELIYKESPTENEHTLEDIAKKGQQVDGVITNNGIIIDGNRRATLLRKLFNGEADKFNQNVEDFRYFNCIVLPNDMLRKEIMALETMLQIGVDEKVKYNRICLYIKVDNLRQAGYSHTQIKQYMNLPSESKVDEMIDVYNLMIQYLKAIGKENHFTLLDKLEDQLIQTNRMFKLLNNRTYQCGWDYSTGDVTEFMSVCFDYMRSKFEGKKYRSVLLGKTQKTDGVFVDEGIWRDFLKRHEDIIDSTQPDNENDWLLLGRTGGKFDVNLNRASEELASIINDKNVSKTINEIKKKILKLDSLLEESSSISKEDISELKTAAKSLSKIADRF